MKVGNRKEETQQLTLGIRTETNEKLRNSLSSQRSFFDKGMKGKEEY